jgi:hypothetical protein
MKKKTSLEEILPRHEKIKNIKFPEDSSQCIIIKPND